MLAIYSGDVGEEDHRLYFAVGGPSLVSSTLSKLQKKLVTIRELLKIDSDYSAMNDFKTKLKANSDLVVRKHLIERLEGDGNHKDNLLRIVMNLFLEVHSSTAANVQVCQDCRWIVNVKEREKIGQVSIGSELFISLLNLKEHWLCKECRSPSEFALVAWESGTRDATASNYAAIVGPRSLIEGRVVEIRRNHSDARLILSIRPALRDAQVTDYIKHKFMSAKPFQICKSNEAFYQEFILEAFLHFFIKDDAAKKKAVRICKYCFHVFLNKEETDLGELLLVNKKEIGFLGEITPNWVCSDCEKSLLILYAMESADGSLDFYIATNKSDRYALTNYEKKYTRIYPCFKFLCSHINEALFRSRLSQMKHVSVHGNIITTKLPRKEFLDKIYALYFERSLKRVIRLNLVFPHFQVCGDCGRGFYEYGTNFGACWRADTSLEIKYCQPRHYYCVWHKFRSILYWNIESYNSLSHFEVDNKSIFVDSDIVCVFGSSNINNCDITGLNFLRNRFVISEHGLKTGSGEEKGGFMIFIKKEFVFSYEKLPYSSKGLFVKIEHGSECTVIGIILWPETDQPSDSVTDWLLELEDTLKMYDKDNTKFILGGNFNCKVGNLNNGFKDETVFWNGELNVQRKSLNEETDARGEQLAQLMSRYNFILTNGRTQSDYPAKSTYSNGTHQMVSDLVWVNQNCGYIVNDMTVLQMHDEHTKLHRSPFLRIYKPPG